MNACPYCQQKAFRGFKKILIGPKRTVQCPHCKQNLGVQPTKAWLALSPFLLAVVSNLYASDLWTRFAVIGLCTLASSLLYLYWVPLEKRDKA